MDSEEKIKNQLTETAKRFFAENMSIRPDSIVVDIHSDCLVITLHIAISKAETAYTKEKASYSLLDRFYKDTFDASKIVFETAVNKVFPKRITGSFISIDPQSRKCVIVVSVCNDNSKSAQPN